MRVNPYTANYQPVKKQKPSFGCQLCHIMINELEEQQIPRKKAILCIDIALNNNMKRLAEIAKEVFTGDEIAIQEAVADHKSAAELIFPTFKQHCTEIAKSIKQNW